MINYFNRNNILVVFVCAIFLCLTQTDNTLNTNRFDYYKRVENSRNASVTIFGPNGIGTGILIHVNDKVYVWTAAHLVDPLWSDPENKIPDNEYGIQDILVLKISSRSDNAYQYSVFFVKLIQSGKRGDDDDLALLEIIDHKNVLKNQHVFFSKIKKYPLGYEVYHIGNFSNAVFPLSLAEGKIINIGEFEMVGSYDLASISVADGSSGGGVFDSSDGRCLGILVAKLEPVGYSPGIFIPTRRMIEFAEKYDLMFAIPFD